jgi:hypothetical protein
MTFAIKDEPIALTGAIGPDQTGLPHIAVMVGKPLFQCPIDKN